MPHILVVDDETDILHTLQATLPRLMGPGTVVATAASAAQAMQLASRERFDVVVTDQRMPGMNGSALLRWFGGEHPTVRRAIMTAFSGPDMLRDAADAGAELVIMKPFDVKGFASQLSGLLAEAPA